MAPKNTNTALAKLQELARLQAQNDALNDLIIAEHQADALTAKE